MIGAQIVTSMPYDLIDSYEDLADNQQVIPLIYEDSAYHSILKVFNVII